MSWIENDELLGQNVEFFPTIIKLLINRNLFPYRNWIVEQIAKNIFGSFSENTHLLLKMHFKHFLTLTYDIT